MIIKKGPSLKDPTLDRNIKHTTPNEIIETTRKRKEKKYKTPNRVQFMKYEEGQFERIFKKHS